MAGQHWSDYQLWRKTLLQWEAFRPLTRRVVSADSLHSLQNRGPLPLRYRPLTRRVVSADSLHSLQNRGPVPQRYNQTPNQTCCFCWQSPQPAEPWTGVLDASKEAPVCVQRGLFPSDVEIRGQEDCLYLNVYTPRVRYPSTDLFNWHVRMWTSHHYQLAERARGHTRLCPFV
jgi:hypothetical protein